MVAVEFYGRFADIMGRSQQLELPQGVTTAATLLEHLQNENPDFAAACAQSVVKVAINDAMAALDSAVSDGDCIAFLPPFSGG